MTEKARLSAPRGLWTPGRALWKSIISAYELRPDEVKVLEGACRVADIVAKLDAEMEGEPLTVVGSMGQLREHPLLSEARQQRAMLNRCLQQLHLPEEGTALGTKSTQARAAARARWTSTPGRKGSA